MGSSSSIENSVAEWMRKPARSRVSPAASALAPRIDANSSCPMALPDCSSRSSEYRTSRAPSLRPSWNVTSCAQPEPVPQPALLDAELLASHGTMRASPLSRVSVSKMNGRTSAVSEMIRSTGSSVAIAPASGM